MKNTLAIGAILLGGIMVYAGFKNWTLADTIRFFAGMEQSGLAPGTIRGNAVPDPNDAPGYKDEQLERNPDGSFKRDENGNMIPKAGEVPFAQQPKNDGSGAGGFDKAREQGAM
ncbi:hypothetical protein Toil_gp25 [Rhodococcus phage Toil]|uniref:Uncharacterized protein n=1 Tax=Rhodococcus phage Toil TaxID=1975614 RepID=A0A1W6DXS5_9VIRU|nr:hypothetical protein KMD62_gp25 [Rhodococcus phage Toil]ARK07708.1 hypothetical protein Toil_gp25 [Rhodococcus phage Toil]